MPDTCPLSHQTTPDESEPPLQAGRASWRLWLAVLAAGVAGGLAGILLIGLLRLVQHLAYGYGGDHLISPVSFLQGVTAASPLRRWLVMLCCGVVAGAGWWALRRFGRPLVGISRTLTEGGAELPAGSTLVHALLQVVTVALGSPLGREVAPREVAAVATQAVADRLALAADERRLVVACAAGAGLAAVYNVPLGGALFVLESLLLSFSWRGALSALASSAIAAALAERVLGHGWQYHIPVWSSTHGLLWWSLLVGPLLGVAAAGFDRLTDWARHRAPTDGRILPWSLGVFGVIGLCGMIYPQVLGNGRGPVAESFGACIGLQLAVTLLLLKLFAVGAALRAGAGGGLLTPSLAIGALAGLVLGQLWNIVSSVPTAAGAFALVGGCAFLAASRKMPITALVLSLEFTHVGYDFLVPMMVAVVGACLARHLCARAGARPAAG